MSRDILEHDLDAAGRSCYNVGELGINCVPTLPTMVDFDLTQTVAQTASTTLDAFHIRGSTVTFTAGTSITTAAHVAYCSIGAPTFADPGGSDSILPTTDGVSTLWIGGPPDTSAWSNSSALWSLNVSSGNVSFGGDVYHLGAIVFDASGPQTAIKTTSGDLIIQNAGGNVFLGTVGSNSAIRVATNPSNVGINVTPTGAHRFEVNTSQTVAFATSATLDAVYFDPSTTNLTGSTGTISTAAGFNQVTFAAPTINGTSTTVTNSATVTILGAPSGTVTITNPYSFWVQTGTTKLAGTTIIQSLSGMLKATAGIVGVGTAGTDYESPLTFSQGVTRVSNAITGDYITGKSGNQTWIGSTTNSGTLTIESSSGTRGVLTLDGSNVSINGDLNSPSNSLRLQVAGFSGFELSQTGRIGLCGATPVAAFQMVDVEMTQTVTSGASATLDAFRIRGSTVTVSGATNITTATGFNQVTFNKPTFSGTVNITNAATVTVTGAPQLGSSLTITNPYAFWVQSGTTNLAGTVVIQSLTGVLKATSGTVSVATGGTDYENPLTFASGLTRATNTVTGDYITGKAGSRTWTSGTANTDALTLQASSGSSTGLFTIRGSQFDFVLPVPAANLTASTESIGTLWDNTRTVTWATGALATQREMYIEAPTYAFAAASTITEASTFAIQSSPFAGTNCTITRPIAFNVQQGFVKLQATNVSLASAASIPLDAFFLGSGTITVTGGTNISTAAGFNYATIQPPTITDSSSCTITTSATLSILGAPIAGGSITITDPLAFWVQAGNERHNVGGETIKAAGREYFDIAPISTPSGGGVTVNHLYTTRIRQQTFANSGASNSITGISASLYLDGPPVYTGTWATGYTNSSLYVAAGQSYFGDMITVFSGVTPYFSANPTGLLLYALMNVSFNQPAITSPSATPTSFGVTLNGAQNSVTISGSTPITTATGYNYCNIAPVNFVNATAGIISDSATVYIGGPPTISGGGSITRAYSLWIDSGLLRYDGQIAAGGGAAATNTTIGGSGPSTAAANGWIKINVDGQTRFLQTWG